MVQSATGRASDKAAQQAHAQVRSDIEATQRRWARAIGPAHQEQEWEGTVLVERVNQKVAHFLWYVEAEDLDNPRFECKTEKDRILADRLAPEVSRLRGRSETRRFYDYASGKEFGRKFSSASPARTTVWKVFRGVLLVRIYCRASQSKPSFYGPQDSFQTAPGKALCCVDR